MSEAEYTINHDIDGWPICKNGEPIFDNKTMLAELHQLQARVKELEAEKATLVETLESAKNLIANHSGEALPDKYAGDQIEQIDAALSAHRKQGGEQ